MSTLPISISDTELATLLHCSKAHVQRLARRGELLGTKFGRGWVFHQTEVDRVLRTRTKVEVVSAKRGRRRKELPRL